jgi:phosphate acetyltransferase
VLHGVARVLAPTDKLRLPRIQAPRLQLFDPMARFRELLALGDGMAAARCAVVHPCDAESLAGTLEATRLGLMDPVLVGPESRLRGLAESEDMDLHGVSFEDVPHSHAAATRAVGMAASGEVQALLRGSLEGAELLKAVQAEVGLRTGRLLSHLYRFDAPLYSKALFITDAVVHPRPDLATKADIVRNAIEGARLLGIERPRVGLLSMVQTVSTEVPSSVDAAALCKMADRKQIHGGLLDGPLRFDDAISPLAAQVRQLPTEVAGQADVLMAPDLESANLLARQLQTLAGATASGIVLGARVPIAWCSRGDGAQARVASALLAQLAVHAALRS